MVTTYRNHTLNKVGTRYRRDFDGFNGKMPSEFHFDHASGSSEDWFFAHMGRFPLLDGLAHEQALANKIAAGLEAHQKLQSGNLNDQSQTELEQLAIIGAGAFETMYECNLRLVASIAGQRPARITYNRLDMIQEGCKGLRRAIQLYDPTRELKFSTYASNWIKQYIARGQNDVAFDVAMPIYAIDKAKEIQRLIGEAKSNNLPLPSDKELIDMGYTPAIIAAARNFMGNNRLYLDKPFKDDSDGTLYDTMAADNVDFDEGLDLAEAQQNLARIALSGQLDSRALLVMSLREAVLIPGVDHNKMVKINGDKPLSLAAYIGKVRLSQENPTLDQIGEIVGLTRERCRQIIVESNARLLSDHALSVLKERLNLDADEAKLFENYFGFMEVPRRTDYQQAAELKRQFCKVLPLLGLLDNDPTKALQKTMEILTKDFKITKMARQRVEGWLGVRFGITPHPKTLLIGMYDAKEFYSLEPYFVRQVESVMLAILAGVWGKVPVYPD